jgi:hypothetical protein
MTNVEASAMHNYRWATLCIGSAAQDVHLGMSMTDVRRVLGMPRSYFADGLHAKTSPRIAHGLVLEVYPRIIRQHQFELRIEYGMDNAHRRPAPGLVIETVEFVAEKPMPTQELLQSFDEARLLCLSGCIAKASQHRGSSLHLEPLRDSGAAIDATTRDDLGDESAGVTSLNDESLRVLIYHPMGDEGVGKSKAPQMWRPK